MESLVLDSLVKQGKTQREIAEILGKSKTTIRYWLEKHNLLGSRHVFCNGCGETGQMESIGTGLLYQMAKSLMPKNLK